jgi:PAS domain S-box-containing protein
LWSTLNDGNTWRGEFVNKKKNGGEHIVATLIAPVQEQNGKTTHFVSIRDDITEKRKIEVMRLEAEQRFRIVANSAPVLIWLADTDKLCYWFNQVWLDFTGRSLEHESGNGWADCVHPDDLTRCLDIYSTYFDRREPFRMEYRLKRKDGEYRWLDDTGVPLFNVEGIFIGYIGSCVDITVTRQAQADLQAS